MIHMKETGTSQCILAADLAHFTFHFLDSLRGRDITREIDDNIIASDRESIIKFGFSSQRT